jgi:hypothetical protein
MNRAPTSSAAPEATSSTSSSPARVSTPGNGSKAPGEVHRARELGGRVASRTAATDGTLDVPTAPRAEGQAGAPAAEVRKQVEDVHAEVRAHVRRASVCVDAVLAGDHDSVDVLKARVLELRVAIEKHLSTQMHVLAPTIANIDAWGEVRRERVVETGERERTCIAEAEKRAACAESPHELAMIVRGLVFEVQELLGKEAREVIEPGLLTDDPVNTDEFGG